MNERTIKLPSNIVDRLKVIAKEQEVTIKDLVLSWVIPMIEECEFTKQFQETFNLKLGKEKIDDCND